MVAHICEYTTNYRIVHSEWVTLMAERVPFFLPALWPTAEELGPFLLRQACCQS